MGNTRPLHRRHVTTFQRKAHAPVKVVLPVVEEYLPSGMEWIRPVVVRVVLRCEPLHQLEIPRLARSDDRLLLWFQRQNRKEVEIRVDELIHVVQAGKRRVNVAHDDGEAREKAIGVDLALAVCSRPIERTRLFRSSWLPVW